MILTPIPQGKLPFALNCFRAHLVGSPLAQAAFEQIFASFADMNRGYDLPQHRQQAVALCQKLGLPIRDSDPAMDFSWNGQAVAIRTEASVLIHEIAHWLVSPAERVGLPDFGLGAGPESGWREIADRACQVDAATREREEAQASVLGILLEAALGLPALFAFLEQNWLEGYERAASVSYFIDILSDLRDRNLIDEQGRPRCLEEVGVRTINRE